MALFWFVVAVFAGFMWHWSRLKTQEVETKLVIQAGLLEGIEQRSRDLDARATELIQKEERANLIVEASNKKSREVSDENTVLHASVEELANLWINDSFKNISDKLTDENYSQQADRLEGIFDRCKGMGLYFDKKQEREFFNNLRLLWDDECKRQRAKDEQTRIKELMREEQRAEKARASELKRIDAEKKELEQKRLINEDKLRALKEAEALKQLSESQKLEVEHLTAENQQLQSDLAEKERRRSMAEMTRAGHVYVISNVGSFGQNVFKVGMTRRLIPEERIKELGDAAVPFPFDVHFMIATTDAPTLEKSIHQALWGTRINLVNSRKEFFKVELSKIKELVEKLGGGIEYEFTEDADAGQWRESEARRNSGALGEFPDGHEHRDDDEDVA